jgi:GntR family transcriptional repressor for pyruvate dehydrogenase complex
MIPTRSTGRTKPLAISPIKPRRVSDQVFEQLREHIARGPIKPGERLMTERELAATLRVSRTTVREALNKMAVMGILEQKQGQGTFVRAMERSIPDSFMGILGSEDATLLDLLDVRLGLECNAARLAALRATSADLGNLERRLAQMRAAVTSGHSGAEAGVAFQMAIAEASRNPLQVHLMRQFYDFMALGIEGDLALLFEAEDRSFESEDRSFGAEDRIGTVALQHERIVAAIRRRDPEAAVDAVQAHIEKIRERLEREGE